MVIRAGHLPDLAEDRHMTVVQLSLGLGRAQLLEPQLRLMGIGRPRLSRAVSLGALDYTA